MKSETRSLADKFDALKKEERIETMMMTVEDGLSPKEISKKLEIGESTARKYLKDLVNAELIVKTDNGYDYTPIGYNMRKDIEIQLEREQAEDLKETELRAEYFYKKNKARTKQAIRDRLSSLIE